MFICIFVYVFTGYSKKYNKYSKCTRYSRNIYVYSRKIIVYISWISCFFCIFVVFFGIFVYIRAHTIWHTSRVMLCGRIGNVRAYNEPLYSSGILSYVIPMSRRIKKMIKTEAWKKIIDDDWKMSNTYMFSVWILKSFWKCFWKKYRECLGFVFGFIVIYCLI